MSIRFEVSVAKYATTHYIKKFQKKHHDKWEDTLIGIEDQCRRADIAIQEGKISLISKYEQISICKGEFKISGTPESAKNSGNRYIVVVDEERATVRILLVYGKGDLKGSASETAKWKKQIKDNYPEYRDML